MIFRAANSLVEIVKFIARHPVGQRDLQGALGRFVRWQVASRVAPGSIVVAFVDQARLVVSRNMTGASGNIYVGLHEFVDMAFTLHLLRSDDLFLDVGANVGTYTVLAGACVGSTVVSVEPVPATVERLRDNVALNRLWEKVEVVAAAAGAVPGIVNMTADADTMNRVLSTSAAAEHTIQVPVRTIDEMCRDRCPALLKMDVEGYEVAALEGARAVLQDPTLVACIVEVLPSAVDGARVFSTLAAHGFRPVAYDPWTRELAAHDGASSEGNTIFVRDMQAARERVAAARHFSVGNVQV